MGNFKHEKIDLGYDDLTAETLPSGRTYSAPNGCSYPSITTVLSILSREAIQAWRARVGPEVANKISKVASGRGTAVHDLLEKYVNNYFMQCAAYAIMWEERTGMPITQLVILIAVDDEKPQVFIEHRDNWVGPLLDVIEQYTTEQKRKHIFGN